jgi:ATP-binding cassette, subfamily B, bacterial MsbA
MSSVRRTPRWEETRPPRATSPIGLALAYAARSWREAIVIVTLTLITSALAMVAPALVAAVLAALDIGGEVSGSAGTAFDLNGLGRRVLAMWPFNRYSDPVTLIFMLGLTYLGQALIAAGVQFVAALASVSIRSDTLRLMQDDLMAHLLRQSMRFFNRSKSGELISRVVQDAQLASSSVGPAVQGLLQYSVQVLGFGVYLFSTSRWLTAGAVVIIALHFGITRWLREPVRRFGKAAQNTQAQATATFQEIITSARVVKSFGAEPLAFERSAKETSRLREARFQQGRIDAFADPARAVIDAVALVAMIAIAANEVRRGRLEPQGLLLYVYVARTVIQPANLLATSYLRLLATGASLTRIAELFEQQPRVVDGDLEPSGFAKALELQDVSFSYDDTPVIRNLTLTIARGQMVAVVGRSGAGKSTLTDLILRLYDPTSGAIVLDGVDVRRFRQLPYRRLFGVVSQEPLLLHDTVRNNIRFGRAGITDEQVVTAARLAHAETFIERLPEGFDTTIGDRGIRLSGGERQRVAIARAIAHRPDILILDEATSSLDSESEHEVQLAVDHLLERATAIVIAHRLSTILHADTIVFLEDGEIADIGPHRELLERCAPYRRLCELQFLHGRPVETGTSP